MSRLSSNWFTSSVYMWIDIRSYKDSNGDGIGDISGLISKLEYLKDLGIGAVMFPGHMLTDFAYGGTMVTGFYDVEPKLGTLEDFDRLITEAHRRSIAVISGWSPYSTHPDHPYFQASRDPNHSDHKTYADYYFWGKDLNARLPPRMGHWEWNEQRKQYYHVIWQTVDGRWCPETNPLSKKLQEETERTIRFWLERGLDGFWVDCADSGDFFEYEDHIAFSRKMNGVIHSYPNKISVAEDGKSVKITIEDDGYDQFWCNQPRPIPVYETVFREPGLGVFVLGPKGMECQGIHEALKSFYNVPKGNQCCNRYGLTKTIDLKSPIEVAKVKQFFALALTLPIVPMFMMGTECGFAMTRRRVGSVSYPSPMMWDHSPNHGFTAGESYSSIESEGHPSNMTVEDQLADTDSVLNCFKELVRIRRENPGLQANEAISISYAKIPTQDDQKYYAFLRQSSKPAEKILVAINLQGSIQEVECNFEKTQYKITKKYRMLDLFSGIEEKTLSSNKYMVELPAYGFKILKMRLR